MSLYDFKIKLQNFEREVIVKGFENGCLKSLFKNHRVSVNNCKLHHTDFGKSMGESVDTDHILTIDYYGYLKKSKGFYNTAEEKECKKLNCKVIHFASIKIEDITAITHNIEVIVTFPKFKNQMLIMRGFRK